MQSLSRYTRPAESVSYCTRTPGTLMLEKHKYHVWKWRKIESEEGNTDQLVSGHYGVYKFLLSILLQVQLYLHRITYIKGLLYSSMTSSKASVLIFRRTFLYEVWVEAKMGFSGSSASKEYMCNARDPGSIPGLERSPGEGIGYALQYSCLENFHGQRSLVGYSPWGHRESDRAEWLSTKQHRG